MTIQQCKYVLSIANTGSFNEAAKQLFIAQSTLSLSIKSLEQELGIRIFDRSANGVYLTEEGSEFVRYASQIVEHDLFVSERYSANDVSKRLYIATQHYDFIADIFGKMLVETQSESYKYALREIKTYDIIHEIEISRSDIGIIAIKDSEYDIMKRYLGKKGIEFTEVLKASPHVFLSKTHPLATSDALSLSDLKDYPYVSYEQGDRNISFFTEEIVSGLQSNKHIEISDRATLMNVLLVTDCYTVGTGIMPSALNRGDIVGIPLKSDDFYIIGYILNTARKLNEETQRFIDLLVESVKKI